MAQRAHAATALTSTLGLTASMQYLATLPALSGTWMLTLLTAGCIGAVSWAVTRRLTLSEVGAMVISVLGPWPAVLLTARLFVLPLDLVVPVGMGAGAAVAAAVLSKRRLVALSSALLVGLAGRRGGSGIIGHRRRGVDCR